MLENIKAALYRNEFNLLVQEFESLHTLYNAIIETRKCFYYFLNVYYICRVKEKAYPYICNISKSC